MQTYNFDSSGRQINAAGTFLRYERETGGAVDASVRVRVDGQDFGVWLPGDYVELQNRFTTVELAPVAAAVGEFRIGSGRFASSRMLMSGSASAPVVSPTNTAKTVTNASSQLLAANAGRKYLLIQNKDSAGTIYVSFGAAATVANGIKISPGGFWEWDKAIPVNAVHAIGDAANNPNVAVVEG